MDIQEISCNDLRIKLVNKDDFFLIDVREPEEFEGGFIPGAVLVPLEELTEHLADFDKEGFYVVNCKMGGRSAEAVLVMMDAGFTNVKSLIGGHQRWEMEYGPSRELL